MGPSQTSQWPAGSELCSGEDIGQPPHDMEQKRDTICPSRGVFPEEKGQRSLQLWLECELPLHR